MKNCIKKFSIVIFILTLPTGFFLIPTNAEAGGRCTCRQQIDYDVCNCDIICPSMSVTVPEGGSVPLQEISCVVESSGARCECATPHPFPADSPDQCTTTCRDNISDPSYGTKRGAGVGEFEEAAGLSDPCDHDTECRGRGCISGDCFCSGGLEELWSGGTEEEYRASGVRGSCAAKTRDGEDCSRPGSCLSNICAAPTPGSDTICGGLTPPGEEETPPQTEEEVFPTYNIKSPIGPVTGPELIGRIIKTVLGVVGALALAMFVFGGFTWLTSAGSADKIKKGKDILIWATIGLIVIFTSYTLVDFILTAFGV